MTRNSVAPNYTGQLNRPASDNLQSPYRNFFRKALLVAAGVAVGAALAAPFSYRSGQMNAFPASVSIRTVREPILTEEGFQSFEFIESIVRIGDGLYICSQDKQVNAEMYRMCRPF